MVLVFNLNGQSVKVVGFCDSLNERRCREFSWLGSTTPNCRYTSKNVYTCTTEGSNVFLIEKKKWESIHIYFIYPVEGKKPNHRYYIPLATINDVGVLPD